MEEEWETFEDCNYEIFGCPSLNEGDKVEGVLIRKNIGSNGDPDAPWDTFYELVKERLCTHIYSAGNLDLQMTHVNEGDYIQIIYHGGTIDDVGVYQVLRKKKR